MPLETTMICMDNSEWMRNGDYSPSRMEALKDAANLVSNAKMQSNPENTVGMMALAGRNPELLVSPTDDVGKIMSSVHDLKLFGNLSFADGVQVAYLALKHRRNKNGGQRIVLLVGSPVEDDAKKLKKVAGNLKKNNIAVDVVSIGEVEENQTKLEDFVKAVDKDSNSNLVSIPPGSNPSDVLISSPIVSEGAGGFGGGGGDMGAGGAPGGDGAPGAAAGGMHDDYGGIDPSLDPELAMVMRMSMEEARREQEATAAASTAEAPSSGDASPPATADAAAPEPLDLGAPTATPAPEPLDTPAAAGGGDAMDDEEALLAQALALSMNVDEAEAPASTSAASSSSSSSSSAAPAMEMDGLDEEMQLALQMSMQLDSPSETTAAAAATPAAATTSAPAATAASDAPAAAAAAAPAAAAAAPANDPAFMTNLLATLPGVDPSDPLIQAALAQIQAKQDEDAKK